MKVKLSQFLQWRFNIFLYLTLGWNLAKLYIFFLGNIYFLFKQKEKRAISKAVSDVIHRTDKNINIDNLKKEVFKGILCHYYEKLYMAFEEKNKAIRFLNRNISSNDLVVLRRCMLKGNGVIAITGHYGAIEYIPTLLAINGFDVSMIAKFKTSQLKKKVFSQAEKYHIKLIDGEQTGKVLKTAVAELKKNRVLITQCDEIEEWRPSQKRKTSFLGQDTGLDRTINVIQKRTKAEVVFGIIHRYNLDDYRLMIYSYKDMIKMIAEESPSSVGETVLKVLEQFIYYHPEQWYQWKKYSEFSTPAISITRNHKTINLSFLRPVFEKIS